MRVRLRVASLRMRQGRGNRCVGSWIYQPKRRVRRDDIMDYGQMEARIARVSTANLYARRTAVRARVVGPFKRTVGMQNSRARMTHEIRIGFRQYLNVMPGRQ